MVQGGMMEKVTLILDSDELDALIRVVEAADKSVQTDINMVNEIIGGGIYE